MATKRKLSGAAAAAAARKAANGGSSSATAAPGPTDAPVTADPAMGRVQRAFANYAVLGDDVARAAAKVIGDATEAATRKENAAEDPDATGRALHAAIADAAGAPLVSIDACVEAYSRIRTGQV